MNSRRLGLPSTLVAAICLTLIARAQDAKDPKPVTESANSNSLPFSMPKPSILPAVPESEGLRTGFAEHIEDFLEDQRQIWTSPAHVRFADAKWLIPLGGIAAGLFTTDRQYSASLPADPSTLRHYNTISNFGAASLVGTGAGLYLFSYRTHNEHWRETGLLAGEASLNSLLTVETLKYSFRRDHPYQADGGAFFNRGTSFPSEHAALAWSIAGVIGHEYPGTLPRLLAYGTASAVSFSRIHARQHFPSDVLIGSALGYMIAQSVYTRHHDPEIGGGAWASPREFVESEKYHLPANLGSPYVPLDSWVYPALERLAALGYIQTAILGMRPWTRMECSRLVGEASERHPYVDAPPEVQQLYASLSREFESEVSAMDGDHGPHAQIESIYARSLVVSGTPLTDNHHFGQTIVNDYGRPYQQGLNSIIGTSGWTTAGPFVIYAWGEYQSSPSAASLSPAALSFVSSVDGLPPNPPAMPGLSVNRFRLLDAYVGMNVGNWQFSFGKQSLWWGPTAGGPMLFTNNSEPLDRMFHINRVSPFRLRSFFQYLGDMRMEFFLGQLSGQEFINNVGIFMRGAQGQYGHSLSPQPFVSGGKISFKFTPNFEFSLSKTTIYGGPGNPLTVKTLFQSALGIHANGEAQGDGRSALDFSYRIPKMRDWLSLYGEGFTEDEVSPLSKPGKSAWQGGVYFAKLPRLPKLDVRLEGGFTAPVDFRACNACFYNNFQYLSGYTNNGQLMGTWIGRAAQGEAISSTYWFSPQKKVSLELRHRQIDRQYLPQGGSQNDVTVNSDFFTKAGFRLTGTLQYERWQIPLLAPYRQSNLAASFQLGYWPHVQAK